MSRRRRQPTSMTFGEVLVALVVLVWAWNHPTGRLVLLTLLAAGVAYVVRWTLRRRAGRTMTRRAATAAATQPTSDPYDLTPYEFEHFCAHLLEQAGWREVEVSGGAGDLGADITGWTPTGEFAVVQAKRYAQGRNVGSPVVQQTIGMAAVHHRACLGMIVTTSGFTRDAVALANQHDQFVLIDGQLLRSAQVLQVLANPMGHRSQVR